MSATPVALLPANPTTTRAQSTKLSADPKGEKIIYAQGRTVIIRPIANSKASVFYSQHGQPVTVARVSPSGFYVASADTGGKVRVWDIAGTDQILKNEVQVIAGRINDLAWDGESKRIIAVGDGRERFGHAFLMDSGSSVGEISGHSKVINAVAMKPQRPFRAVTASDDTNLVFFHGAPYKYNKSISTHTKFVQDVAYAPSGDFFASVGSDGKLFVYDGTTGDVISDLSGAAGAEAHKGTIFALSISPDSKSIVTAGADASVKLWDVAAKKLAGSWDLSGQSGGSDKVLDQQVGITFAGAGRVVSLSFGGDLNIIDLSSAGKVQSKLYGAGKSISVGSLASGGDDKTLIAGSFDGRTFTYTADGDCKPVEGPRHSNAVTAVRAAGKVTFTAGMDDTVRRIEGGSYSSSTTALSGLPKGLSASSNGLAIAITSSGVDLISASSGKSSQSLDFTPTAVASTLDGEIVAIGSEDAKVHLFLCDGKTLKPMSVLQNNRSTVTALAFSPDGGLLAAGESGGKILVYDVADNALKLSQWVFHTGRINAIEFSPDGTHAASVSLDTNLYIWSVAKPTRNIVVKNAHAGGAHGVAWLDDDRVASAGADGCVRLYDVKRHT